MSVVGFLFRDTRLLGVPVSFHRHFEEVNLRFYVKREVDGEVQPAVTFVREIVPQGAIATVARLASNEPYVAAPMAHTLAIDPEAGGTVAYGWRYRGERFALSASASGPAEFADPASEAAFITEHFLGYTRQRDGGTLEYSVEHPSWRLWTPEAAFTGDALSLYGSALTEVVNIFAQYLFLARVQFLFDERIAHPMDATKVCRAYIRERCAFAYQTAPDSPAALEVERRLKREVEPVLNP